MWLWGGADKEITSVIGDIQAEVLLPNSERREAQPGRHLMNTFV